MTLSYWVSPIRHGKVGDAPAIMVDVAQSRARRRAGTRVTLTAQDVAVGEDPIVLLTRRAIAAAQERGWT